mmetsp:Transcript_8071/g.14911  ORF Transcript_8071/g.14911 Transcript_8071/m.14911 type:complete len:206 (+) Transcript_8071:525-1142(+)
MASFDIDDDESSFDFHGIRGPVGPFHVFFVFVLDESVPSRLSSLLILDEFDILDGSKGFHFSQQFAFRDFVGQSADKQSVVTIHSLKLSSAFSLELSVLLNDRFSFFFQSFAFFLEFFCLEGLGRWLDDPFWRSTLFELVQIGKDARDGMFSFVFDRCKLFNGRIRHERGTNMRRHHHDGRLRVRPTGHLPSGRRLSTAHPLVIQ